jgi:Zn-dependent M28 family amino/carboxypeptidase
MALVQTLSQEPRVSGTPAEARAAEYISSQFRSYGYSTEIMEFSFDGDRFRAGEATAAGKTYQVLTLAGSPGGNVSAPSAYVGLADDGGIAGQNLSGKMAIADRGSMTFVEKYNNVKAAGAIGLIVVNNQPGPFTGNLTTLSTIPVAGMSQEDGAALIATAKQGGVIGLNAPPTVGDTNALNVIARAKPGAACTIVVGGHFDSVPGAPGANDNASGAASVVELARAAAADGLDDGLCFVTYGAEESGLYGSKALVQKWKDENVLPRYAINLDVTGIGDQVEVIGDGQLAKDSLSIAAATGIKAAASKLPPNAGSDHQSWIDASVPTVFFSSGDFPTIHSPQDVSTDIQPAELDRIGDLSLDVIKTLLAQVARG